MRVLTLISFYFQDNKNVEISVVYCNSAVHISTAVSAKSGAWCATSKLPGKQKELFEICYLKFENVFSFYLSTIKHHLAT